MDRWQRRAPLLLVAAPLLAAHALKTTLGRDDPWAALLEIADEGAPTNGTTVLSGSPVDPAAQDKPAKSYKATYHDPGLVPRQFLLISSPATGKIGYTELATFHSKDGSTRPLVSSGLKEPAGLAWDTKRGHLYVADRAEHAIFRYTVGYNSHFPDGGDGLFISGPRVDIAVKCSAEWVALDQSGNVYFTDRDTNSVNKISKNVIDELATALYEAEDLVVNHEEQLEQAAFDTMRAKNGTNKTIKISPSYSKVVEALYEGAPKVAMPAGVASDGLNLFWANGMGAAGMLPDGSPGGAVVSRGLANPKNLPASSFASGVPPAFPSIALVNGSDTAYGLVKTNKMVFYTSVQNGKGKVKGVSQYGGAAASPVDFATELREPRGLAWDGDGTLYVADQETSKVWTLAAGAAYSDGPITEVVDFAGAYGLALVSKIQPAFALLEERGARSSGARAAPALLKAFVGFSFMMPFMLRGAF